MIRIATEEDIQFIVALVNKAFLIERAFIPGDRTSAVSVRELMTKGVFYLAEDKGIIVGSIYTELRGDRGYFGMLAVDPSQQGKGVGRRLIETAEEYCASSGCGAMDITVINLRTELPPLYRKFGYSEQGTREYEGIFTQPLHLILMSKPL